MPVIYLENAAILILFGVAALRLLLFVQEYRSTRYPNPLLQTKAYVPPVVEFPASAIAFPLIAFWLHYHGIRGLEDLLIVPVAVYGCTWSAIRPFHMRAKRRYQQAMERRNQAMKAAEDEWLKSSIEESRVRTIKVIESLPQHLVMASATLAKASILFEERKFGEYWDAIDVCYKHLSEYNKTVGNLFSIRKNRASGRMAPHIMIVQAQSKEPLPTIQHPDTVLRKLDETLCRAKSDFQFASILEQRRTQAIIKDGLAELKAAVNESAKAMESSISALERTVRDASREQREQERASSQQLLREVRTLNDSMQMLRRMY